MTTVRELIEALKRTSNLDMPVVLAMPEGYLDVDLSAVREHTRPRAGLSIGATERVVMIEPVVTW